MYTKLLIASLIASFPAAVSAATAVAPSSKTAVIIDAAFDTSRSNVTSLSAGGLQAALVNYCRYFLSSRNADFEIMQAPGETSQQRYAELLLSTEFDLVIRLHGHGRYESRKITWTDRRRRHHRRTVNGFAAIEIAYEYFIDDGGTAVCHRRGTVRERANRYWQNLPVHLRNRTADSIVAFNPEPLGYVVQRALSRALCWVGPGDAAPADTAGSLPVKILADSSFIQSIPNNWRPLVKDLLEVASRALREQFGCGLHPVELQPTRTVGDSSMTFQQVYSHLLRTTPRSGDTLIVVLIGHAGRVGLVPERHRQAIGRTELGRRLILLDGLPYPHPRQPTWQSFEGGLNLLHEVGHALGAIHVADLSSVMNPNTNWMASDRFDPLNRTIIQAALDGRLSFDDPAAYLRLLSRQLEESEYNLADYPAFLFEFLNHGGNRTIQDRLRSAVGRPSYLVAAEGYGRLKQGYLSRAAKLFRQAIEDDPTQATLYFYLSEVTRGEEAEKALNQAAAMGHSEAQSRVGAKSMNR
ncbi:MAG: hypothetical protein KAW46_04840 [candidate division Zixibacteria bacterium]|nr:hypothetical protein [candidate division Zixibacteria bacterium]